MMEVGLAIARLVIDSRGAMQCNDEMLQRAHEIIESGSPLSIHTFIVHRKCQMKFAQCASAILLEIWTIRVVVKEKVIDEKILDALFLKNAVRSHLHFSQLNSWIMSNGGQLPNDTLCEYRISLDGSVGLGGQLSNLEVHEFPLGRFDPLTCVCVTVRWRKYDTAPRLLPCSESSGSVTDEWLLPSKSLSFERNAATTSSSSSSGMPFFYVPAEYQQNCEGGRMEFENIGSDATATAISGTPVDLKPVSNEEQLSAKDNPDIVDASKHIACKSPHIHSDPRICQFFNFQKDAQAKNEGMVLENEQIVGSPVIESLSDFLSASSESSTASIKSSLHATVQSFASRRENLPRRSLIASAFRFMSTASKAFSKTTGLPLNSSPAPFSRNETKFVEKQPDDDVKNGSIVEKTARTDFLRGVSTDAEDSGPSDNESICTKRSTSSSSGLLCNFEESALNGRLEPVASLGDFRLQIAASGTICSPHLTLPVITFFFNMPEDEAPLPYLGLCSLEHMRKGYRIPKKGNLQAVLFNPQGTVVRMFLVKFDVSDMPPSSQTFLRQRTFFMPVGCTYNDVHRSWLKYLIHLSLATDRRGRLFIHTDIRMLFSQKTDLETLNLELGKDVDKYQLQSFTEMPRNPKYSSRK